MVAFNIIRLRNAGELHKGIHVFSRCNADPDSTDYESAIWIPVIPKK